MKLKPEAEKLPPTAPLLAALCRCRLTAAAAGFSGLTLPLFPPTRSQIEQEEKPPAQRNGKSQRQSPSLPPSFSPLSPARDSGFRQKGTHSIDPVPFSCLTSFFFLLFFLSLMESFFILGSDLGVRFLIHLILFDAVVCRLPGRTLPPARGGLAALP